MPGNSHDPALTGVPRQPEPAGAPRFTATDGRVLAPPADRPWLATRTGWWEFHADHAGGDLTAVHTADPATGLRPRTVTGATPWALEEQLGFPLPHLLHQSLRRLRRPAPRVPTPDTAAPPSGSGIRGVPGDPPVGGPVHGVRGFGPTWASRLHLPDQPDLPAAVLFYGKALRADPPGRRVWHAGEIRLDVVWASPTANGYRLSHRDQIIFAGEDLVVEAPEWAATDEDVRRLVYLLTTYDPDAVGMTTPQRRFVEEHGQELTRAIAPPATPYPVGTRVIDASLRRGTIAYLIGDPGGEVTSYGWRPDLAELPGHPWRDLPHAAVITAAAKLLPTLEGIDVGLEGWTPARPLAYGALVTIPNPDDTATVTATVIRGYTTPAGIVYHLQPHDYSTARVVVPASAVSPIRGTAWPSWSAMVAARDTTGIVQDPDEIIDFAILSQPGMRAAGYLTSAAPAPAVEIIGGTAQVRDIDHGVIEAPRERFIAALAWDRYDLAALLHDHDPAADITGAESTTTLAALAARNASIPLGPPQTMITGESYPRYDIEQPYPTHESGPDFDILS
jgi:hypothetical protein